MAASQAANNMNADVLLADPAIDKELRGILFGTPTPRNQTMSNHQSAKDKFFNIVNELKTKYPSAKAVSMAVKQNPDLHKAMLEEVNPGKKFS